MIDSFGVYQFLIDYPEMQLQPSTSGVVFRGNIFFTAQGINFPELADCYELEIVIPKRYPHILPMVTEVGGRIPRDAKYHVNTNDGTLCLGSNLTLLNLIDKNPTISEFAKKCIIPYLYAVSRVILQGDKFIFGELEHGTKGMLDDYAAIFELNRPEDVIRVLYSLSIKKRVANKLPCPCSCKKRLGKCKFNIVISHYRKITSRYWAQNELRYFPDSVLKNIYKCKKITKCKIF
jgi:hypothetical protein